MSKYTRKLEVVTAEVLTPVGYERLFAADPGTVKRASVGDYLVAADGGPVRIVPREQFVREYEPVVEGVPTAAELPGKVEAIAEALETSFGHYETLERQLRELGDRVAKLEATPGESTKPETPKAKGK